MIITTTRVTQMHDIAKTLQDGPESVTDILWSEGPWLDRVIRPLQHMVTISVEAKTCVLTPAALHSTSPSSPLHAPCTPSTPGSQVSGVNSPCSPLLRPGTRWHLPK